MDLYQQHTKNIHKYNLRKMLFWGEICGFYLSENHVKLEIKVITKLPNSEQSYKGKVQTHNYINRQNQSTTGKL